MSFRKNSVCYEKDLQDFFDETGTNTSGRQIEDFLFILQKKNLKLESKSIVSFKALKWFLVKEVFHTSGGFALIFLRFAECFLF
jgi:hypothetical protein